MEEGLDVRTAIERLDREWEHQDGFLGHVRHRDFDPKGLDRLIDVEGEESLDRELVSKLWFIPLFLEWQKPGFLEAGKHTQSLESAVNRIVPLLFKILGAP
jgi:hypothetical protein